MRRTTNELGRRRHHRPLDPGRDRRPGLRDRAHALLLLHPRPSLGTARLGAPCTALRADRGASGGDHSRDRHDAGPPDLDLAGRAAVRRGGWRRLLLLAGRRAGDDAGRHGGLPSVAPHAGLVALITETPMSVEAPWR